MGVQTCVLKIDKASQHSVNGSSSRGLTSSCAVMLQLVAVDRLLGVCPFPGGAMDVEKRERGGGERVM